MVTLVEESHGIAHCFAISYSCSEPLDVFKGIRIWVQEMQKSEECFLVGPHGRS